MIIYRTGSPGRAAPRKRFVPPPPPRRAPTPPPRFRLTTFTAKKITPGPKPTHRVMIPHPARGPVSPYVNPFRFGGVSGSRIDQGVDYAARPGTRIGALGPGRIVSALSTGSGWPGGGFIAEQLSKGPARGQVVYTAEDVAPTVVTGQRVKAGQVIGQFTTGGSIESGWGTRPPNVGQALAYGTQSAPGADPGAYSTGYGIAFDRLIRALGGPAGVMQSTISGGAPPMFSATGGQPGRHRVSLPPAPPAVTVPSGVNPAGGGGPGRVVPPASGVRLTAADAPVTLHPRRKPQPWPVDPHRKKKPPVPTPTPTPTPSPVTGIASSLGTGGVSAVPPPATPASSGSGMTLLLVAGAGVVLLFILMRKKKGKGKPGKK